MELQSLNCSRCGASLTINETHDSSINCSFCGSTLLIFHEEDKITKSFVPIPSGFTIDKSVNELTITFKNKGPKFYILLGFSITWIIFCFGFMFMGPDSSFSIIFGIAPLFIGLALFYYGLTGILNTTILQIKDRILTVTFKPLWWFGSKNIETNKIIQLFTKQIEYKNNNSITYAYSLEAIMRENQTIKVLSMIESAEVCRCFEQQIERFLHINKLPIEGEYRFQN